MEDLLKLINMDAKSRAQRDITDYSTTNDNGSGGVERGFLERTLDSWLGQEEAVQKEARDIYTKGLRNSQSGKALRRLNPTAEFSATEDDTDIDTRLLNKTNQKSAISEYKGTGGATLTSSDLNNMSAEEIESLIPGARRTGANRDFNSNPQVQYQIQRDDEARDRQTLQDNRLAFQQSENRKMQAHQFDMNMLNKNAQLDLQRLELAGRREDRRMAREDRQADKRQASIMMLIKGLSQLGAGFSI